MSLSYIESIANWYLPQELKGTYEKIVSGDIVTYNINDLDVNDPKRIKIEHTLKSLKKPEKRGFYGGL